MLEMYSAPRQMDANTLVGVNENRYKKYYG